jgi:hypothetical protein
MKLLVHTCDEQYLEARKKWLTEEVGLPIFKIRKVFSPIDAIVDYQIVVIVVDEDLESFLKLKYPPHTFEDFTA